MKRNLGKGKAKGTVLFTVVTVMMVMVVLLMTTLTLTSSAKRRSYYTYFESQAQYTATAALNAVTFNAYQNEEFHNWVTNSLGNIGDEGEIQIRFDGSRIQFTQDGDGNPDNDNTVRCVIRKIEPDVKWDAATDALHPRDMWRITATASVGNGRNASTYSVSQYLYENFQVPVERLGNPALNTAEYSFTRIIPGVVTPPDDDEVIPLSSSPGMVMFGNTGFSNNMVTMGPCYNNLGSAPRGWGRYNDAPDGYNIFVTNQNMAAVGNVIMVNNVSLGVAMNVEFQKPKEGAVYYGNLAVDNQGFRYVANCAASSGAREYEDACNYVYVDGMLYFPNPTGSVTIGSTDDTNPINLYCGGLRCDTAGQALEVTGDVYMYDPNATSEWMNDGGTPLSEFVDNEISKASDVDGYAKKRGGGGLGGNIICNNRSLYMHGKDNGATNTIVVNGDIVMTQPNSTLTLSNVVVNGNVYSAGTVEGYDGTVYGLDKYNSGYYTDSYVQSQQNTAYDYRLMPYLHRIDEIFQTYYRWDLASGNSGTAGSALTTDNLILESIAAGHTWNVQEFTLSDGSALYVPYTNATQGRWVIPTHQFYNPNSIVNSYTNGKRNCYTKVGDFTSGSTLSEYDFTGKVASAVTVVGHDANGNETSTPLPEKYYIIKDSCIIDVSKIPQNVKDGFFIDPSSRAADAGPIKIVVKGTPPSMYGGQNALRFIVNNTATYGGNYSSPTAYGESNYVNSIQVQIFLDQSFSLPMTIPIFATSGIWAQWAANNISVVQEPAFPGDDGWDVLDDDVKYAYELVPNMTIFGEGGHHYDFSGSNNSLFNADVVIPLSSFDFGTPNNQVNVTYREYPGSNYAYRDKTYVWSVGSVCSDYVDFNDKYALCAYIGANGVPTSSPPPDIHIFASSSNSSPQGENNNPYFNDDYISAG